MMLSFNDILHKQSCTNLLLQLIKKLIDDIILYTTCELHHFIHLWRVKNFCFNLPPLTIKIVVYTLAVYITIIRIFFIICVYLGMLYAMVQFYLLPRFP